MLSIDLDLLKVFCVLTDKFTKQKISSLNGLEHQEKNMYLDRHI